MISNWFSCEAAGTGGAGEWAWPSVTWIEDSRSMTAAEGFSELDV